MAVGVSAILPMPSISVGAAEIHLPATADVRPGLGPVLHKAVARVAADNTQGWHIDAAASGLRPMHLAVD